MSRNRMRSSFAGAKRQADGSRACKACAGSGEQHDGGRCRGCNGYGVFDRGRPRPARRRREDDDE